MDRFFFCFFFYRDFTFLILCNRVELYNQPNRFHLPVLYFIIVFFFLEGKVERVVCNTPLYGWFHVIPLAWISVGCGYWFCRSCGMLSFLLNMEFLGASSSMHFHYILAWQCDGLTKPKWLEDTHSDTFSSAMAKGKKKDKRNERLTVYATDVPLFIIEYPSTFFLFFSSFRWSIQQVVNHHLYLFRSAG